jgi:hypothetical protein
MHWLKILLELNSNFWKQNQVNSNYGDRQSTESQAMFHTKVRFIKATYTLKLLFHCSLQHTSKNNFAQMDYKTISNSIFNQLISNLQHLSEHTYIHIHIYYWPYGRFHEPAIWPVNFLCCQPSYQELAS